MSADYWTVEAVRENRTVARYRVPDEDTARDLAALINHLGDDAVSYPADTDD